jgi:transcriptional regulator GlxA family with amidase domain
MRWIRAILTLSRARIDAAQSLLASTEDEIAPIAFGSGFRSPSRCYLAFEQRFDMSPGAFRRLRQGNARPSKFRLSFPRKRESSAAWPG